MIARTQHVSTLWRQRSVAVALVCVVATNLTGLDLNAAISTPNIIFSDYGVLNSIITTGQVVAQLNSANVTLQANNDITVAAAIDASGNTVGKALTLQAGHDVILNAALTSSSLGGGSFILSAGNNVTIGAAITASGGSVMLSAGNNGTGPGVAGGTVNFAAGAVTAANFSVHFNPVNYTTTSAEIAAYRAKATLTGTYDARAWAFINNASATAQNKTYDGTANATLNTPFTFLAGPDGSTPGQIVSLVAGASNFNSKDVTTANTVSFTGYGLAGSDVGSYALFSQPANQAAQITPASVTITGMAANNKVYDGTLLATLSNVGSVATGIVGEALVLNGPLAGNLQFNDPNVPLANRVTGTGYSLADGVGGLASNYALTATTSTAAAQITPVSVTITADALGKVYGTAEPALTYTTRPSNSVTPQRAY